MQIGRKIPIAIERYLLSWGILALLVILYAPLLTHWYFGWLKISKISIEHEYYSHGLIGLPFAAYISWLDWDRWHQLPDTAFLTQQPAQKIENGFTAPANVERLPPALAPLLGAVLLVLGGGFYLSGLSDLVNLSFPAILAGLCLWLKGFPGFKLQSFPLLLVFLATPTALPYLIAPFTLPLQQFIAGTAGFILTLLGLQVTVKEIYLLVGGRIVEVAPFCAGLKMLFTSLYVAMMLLYWTGAWTSRTKTVLLLVGTVVISVSGNIVRNTLLTFFHGTGREPLFEWLHEGWGGDVYSACLLVLIMVLLNQIERFSSESPE